MTLYYGLLISFFVSLTVPAFGGIGTIFELESVHTGRTDCRDNFQQCPTWKSQCSIANVRNQCKKSCGECEEQVGMINNILSNVFWTWGPYGECSRKCGGGLKRRYRQCNGAPCSGNNFQEAPCNNQPCKEECKDENQFCIHYASTCSWNSDTRTQCEKTCGLCDLVDDDEPPTAKQPQENPDPPPRPRPPPPHNPPPRPPQLPQPPLPQDPQPDPQKPNPDGGQQGQGGQQQKCPMYKLNFPERAHEDNYARLKTTLNGKEKYTVCAIANFNKGYITGSLVSYATPNEDQALGIMYDGGKTSLYFNGDKIGSLPKNNALNGEHCTCVVFCGNVNGVTKATVYINGEVQGVYQKRTQKPAAIDEKGIIVVGQKQTTFPDKVFNKNEGYKGCIKGLRIWERQLTEAQIKAACKGNYCERVAVDTELAAVQVKGGVTWSKD